MITKIFFTMLVIVVVGMMFAKRSNERMENVKKQSAGQAGLKSKQSDTDNSIPPRALAYGLIALLMLISGVVYYFSWSADNTLVKLRLVGLGGHVTEYQAYKKDIKKRSFITISGKTIRMADSDRMELLE